MIKLNPADFEYTVEYVSFLASHVFTNKYYEFVQGDDPTQTTIAHYKLRSVFSSVADLSKFSNPVYCMSSNSNLLYRFQQSRRELHFVPRQMVFWHEHFCRYLGKPVTDEQFSKQTLIRQQKTANQHVVDEIIANLRQVNDLRRGKNELVFSAPFILEHVKLVTLLRTITGMTDEEIDTRTNGKGLSMDLPMSPGFRFKEKSSSEGSQSDEETKD